MRNRGRGAHGAVLTGFAASTAPFAVVLPADDDYNAGILDAMVAQGRKPAATSSAPAASCPAAAWSAAPGSRRCWCAPAISRSIISRRLPTRDASNGFRLFSRRVMDEIAIESDRGFCYSIELLVKCHRLGWRIGEVPAQWYERTHGTSRFQVIKWLPAYLRWYFYAFATTYLRRPAHGADECTRDSDTR